MAGIRAAWRVLSGTGFRVHSHVCQAVGVSVRFSPDVFVRDRPDLTGEDSRPRMERLQTRMLHTVVPEHLLNEQERV